MTIRFTKSWNGYYEGQIVTNPAGGNTEAQLIALGYAVSDLDGPDNSFELAKFATDTSGNVTGLVGPGGEVIGIKRDLAYHGSAMANPGTTLFGCTTTAGCSLTGAGVTMELVSSTVPGIGKVGNSIKLTIPVGVTGSITFPSFAPINVRNQHIALCVEQLSSDLTRAGAVYLATDTGLTNQFRCDPLMGHAGLMWFSVGVGASGTDVAATTGTPTWQTIGAAKLLVNNTAGAVPYVVVIHEVCAAGRQPPTVSLIIDDCDVSAYTEWLPMLNHYGLKAAFSVIQDLTNVNGGYCTTAQLDRIYAAGHDIAPHGLSALSSYGTVALAKADITKNYEFVKSLGYTRGSDYYVYPNGVSEYAVGDATSIANHLASLGMRAAYKGNVNFPGQSTFVVGGVGKLRIPRHSVDASFVPATLLTKIDFATETGRASNLMAHAMVASGASGIAANRADVETLLTGLASRQQSTALRVLPPSQVHSLLGL